MKTIKAKTIMQTIKNGNGWFAPDYNMNLYRGCCHGCIYCDSRSNCYRVENFDEVTVKADALRILDRELAYKKKGVVGLGAMSDHYNPFEKEMLVTRGALKLLAHHGYGLSMETKSAMITRDIDVFKKIMERHNLILKMTITCADDTLCRKIEPYVSLSSERFNAIKQLSDAGIFIGVLFTPWLPFISDTEENVKAVVKKAYEAGAKFVFAFSGVTLRENQMEYYFEKIDELFPGLSQKYRQVYRGKYVCNTLHKGLRKLFESECKKYGLLYRMPDIIAAYKQPRGIVQERLF